MRPVAVRHPTVREKSCPASAAAAEKWPRFSQHEAENRLLHARVTLRKCSTLYNFPTNSPSNTARAPAGGTYSVNPL
jgi:hypothetical protein